MPMKYRYCRILKYYRKLKMWHMLYIFFILCENIAKPIEFKCKII